MESALAPSSNLPFRPFPTGRQALELARAGLRGLARIGEHWGLTVDQQRVLLGGLPRTTYYALLNGTARTVSADLLERLSLLMGIWGSLEILIPNPQASLAWMRRPHADHRFGEQAPLDWILQGTVAALVDLRRYLEAWRFGR